MLKDKRRLILYAPLFLFLTVYFAGLIVQYKHYFTNMLSPEESEQIAISMNPIKSFTYAFSDIYGIYVMLGVGVFFGLILLKVTMGYIKYGTLDKERNFTYADSGAYGTAKWMTEKDIKQVADIENHKKTEGYILGQLDATGTKLVSKKPESRMNNHVAVFGASGTGKSRCFSRNYMIQAVKRRESVIVTDPKGELFEDAAEFFRNNGYVVKIFNLVNPERSDSWNCLKEVAGSELMAQVFADTIISNTSMGGKGDHFWDNSEMNLLKALVLRVERGETYKRDNIQHMGTVYELLTSLGEGKLDKLFNPSLMTQEERVAITPYNIFKQAGEAVRGGIILGLGTRLQVFQNEVIRKITSEDDIDLTLPGKKPCAYFCIMSDQDSTLNFLSSLFFSFLFIDLVRYADSNGGKCDVPVNFILDEFPNIGQIVDFTKKISTVRSRGLNISVIFQAVSQLQNRYPDGQWQEILGNCDTHLFLGCNDPDTADFISARSGEITINVNSVQAFKTNRLNPLYTNEQRESFGEGKRMLLTKDEVLRMPLDECLIIFRGQNAIKARKYDFSNHPRAKEFVKTYIRDYPSIYDTETRAEMKRREKILIEGEPEIEDLDVEIIDIEEINPEELEVIEIAAEDIEFIPSEEPSPANQQQQDPPERSQGASGVLVEEEDTEAPTTSKGTPTRTLFGREVSSSTTEIMTGNLVFNEDGTTSERAEPGRNGGKKSPDDDDLDLIGILNFEAEESKVESKKMKGLHTQVNESWFDEEYVPDDEEEDGEEEYVPAGETFDGLSLKKKK